MKKKEKQDQFNPANERIKYKYRIHVKRALKKDEKTILAELKYLREYEIFSLFAGFEKYNCTQADKYINYLFDQDYSISYINDALRTLKVFITWLERQKGYRSKIDYNDIDYLNLSNNQRRAAKAKRFKHNPARFFVYRESSGENIWVQDYEEEDFLKQYELIEVK